jgi:hypothetical protein
MMLPVKELQAIKSPNQRADYLYDLPILFSVVLLGRASNSAQHDHWLW